MPPHFKRLPGEPNPQGRMHDKFVWASGGRRAHVGIARRGRGQER